MFTMHYTIKDMSPQERPRERLIQYGAHSLHDSELIALILATGASLKNGHMTAIDLARSVLKKFSLTELTQVSVNELTEIQGIGEAKAARLIAAIALAYRISSASHWDKPQISGPESAAALVMSQMRFIKKEYFKALLLNAKNKVIKICDIHVGTVNASLVHPREVFREAIRNSAVSCIVIHNHPSGDPTPSQEDIKITERLIEAGEIIGIAVLDHIIIGDNTFLSFKQQGIL